MLPIRHMINKKGRGIWLVKDINGTENALIVVAN
jgi:hypothetical protein